MASEYSLRTDVPVDSDEAAELLIEFCKDYVTKVFSEERNVPPTYVVMHQTDPTTLQRCDQPRIGVMSYADLPSYAPPFGSAESKNLFAGMMRVSNQKLKAAGSAFICESWHVALGSTNVEHAMYAHFKGNLRHHPNRGEAVYIHMEHAAWGPEAKSIFVPILKEPGSVPTLGDWPKAEQGQEEKGGRFTNLRGGEVPGEVKEPPMIGVFPIK